MEVFSDFDWQAPARLIVSSTLALNCEKVAFNRWTECRAALSAPNGPAFRSATNRLHGGLRARTIIRLLTQPVRLASWQVNQSIGGR